METTSFALYFFVLFIGALIGLTIYFQKNVPQYLKLFPALFLVTLIVEYTGYRIGLKGINNLALYNFFTIFYFCFLFLVLRLIIQRKRVKKIISYCSILFPLIAFYSNLFLTGLHVFPTVIYSIGAILITIFTCSYFYDLFKMPTKINLIRNPAFWICSGLLIFFTCSLPLLLTENLLANLTKPLADEQYYKIVNLTTYLNHGLNVIYYSTFIAAFLCKIENL